MKAFSEFMTTDIARRNCDPEFYDRFTSNGVHITSLNQLVRFAHERWPTHFHADSRKSTGMPCGRDAMAKLWSAYLAWSEVEAPKKKAS